MIRILSLFQNGAVSTKVGATFTVWVPIGVISNSDERNFVINLVDVTRVEPINSPILSWVSLKGNSHHWPHLLPRRLTNIENRACNLCSALRTKQTLDPQVVSPNKNNVLWFRTKVLTYYVFHDACINNSWHCVIRRFISIWYLEFHISLK